MPILITVLIIIAVLAMLVIFVYAVSSLICNWDQRHWY